jgi:hypothetical protein
MEHTEYVLPSKHLIEKYPPSEPCTCAICRQYCTRPGWWTVEQAIQAIAAGYARRMMLEVSPERTVAVVAPAFKGCEGFFGLDIYSSNGCTFLKNDRCQLHGSELLPLECAFCHHSRPGMGRKCHADLEKEWASAAGRELVIRWMHLNGLWGMRHLCQVQWLK